MHSVLLDHTGHSTLTRTPPQCLSKLIGVTCSYSSHPFLCALAASKRKLQGAEAGVTGCECCQVLLTGLVPYFFWWLLIHSYSFMLLLTPDTCQGERERRRERKKEERLRRERGKEKGKVEKIRRGGREGAGREGEKEDGERELTFK